MSTSVPLQVYKKKKEKAKKEMQISYETKCDQTLEYLKG